MFEMLPYVEMLPFKQHISNQRYIQMSYTAVSDFECFYSSTFTVHISVSSTNLYMNTSWKQRRLCLSYLSN